MPEESGASDLYLTDLSPTDKPWDEHRAISEVIESLYERAPNHERSELDFERYAQRIRDCSRLLNFALVSQEDGSYRFHLHTARFCRVRHCAVCQWRRSLMWRARFFTALPKVAEAYPTARWIFLTLTVRNCPLSKLRDTLAHMNRAWGRMTERKAFPALGWIKSVEVTRAMDDSAHPHFHCLLMVPASYFGKGYLKKDQWIKLWQQCLRVDYEPSIDIQVVKTKAGLENEPELGEATALQLAILETLKYSVKPEDLAGFSDPMQVERNVAWLTELTQQLFKTRAIAVGGVLKPFIAEEEPEDLIHAEGEELELTEQDVQLWFGWREMVRRYLKVERDDDD
jgi:plasmid rolling circle replication initiator protein Rep